METRLTRTVRFSTAGGQPRGPNGYAGSPPMDGLGVFAALTVECRGEPDHASGYLLNITAIDGAVDRLVRPRVERARAGPADLAVLLGESLDALDAALPASVAGVELALSPYHAVAMTSDDRHHAEVRLKFDFAAAHRLHVPGWDEATNREHFGKCNNPSGHGHNYQVEVWVALPAETMGRFSITALERAVQAAVIERFDHKHLNLDTEEFADGTGLNPSVENIARVCYGLLTGPVAGLAEGVSLRAVRVWETDRTSSQYPA